MELEMFAGKILIAASRLISICSMADASEEQVKQVTAGVSLPVTFENDSYTVDPVRMAVVIVAYRPRLRTGTTIETVVERAWQWLENKRKEETQTVPS